MGAVLAPNYSTVRAGEGLHVSAFSHFIRTLSSRGRYSKSTVVLKKDLYNIMKWLLVRQEVGQWLWLG